MRIDVIQAIICFAVSFLIAFGFYIVNNNQSKLLISVGSFVFITTTLIVLIAVRFAQPRTTSNIKVVSGIFFIVALISNIIFSLVKCLSIWYIITNGIIFLFFLLIIYSIKLAKQ